MIDILLRKQGQGKGSSSCLQDTHHHTHALHHMPIRGYVGQQGWMKSVDRFVISVSTHKAIFVSSRFTT